MSASSFFQWLDCSEAILCGCLCGNPAAMASVCWRANANFQKPAGVSEEDPKRRKVSGPWSSTWSWLPWPSFILRVLSKFYQAPLHVLRLVEPGGAPDGEKQSLLFRVSWAKAFDLVCKPFLGNGRATLHGVHSTPCNASCRSRSVVLLGVHFQHSPTWRKRGARRIGAWSYWTKLILLCYVGCKLLRNSIGLRFQSANLAKNLVFVWSLPNIPPRKGTKWVCKNCRECSLQTFWRPFALHFHRCPFKGRWWDRCVHGHS